MWYSLTHTAGGARADQKYPPNADLLIISPLMLGEMPLICSCGDSKRHYRPINRLPPPPRNQWTLASSTTKFSHRRGVPNEPTCAFQALMGIRRQRSTGVNKFPITSRIRRVDRPANEFGSPWIANVQPDAPHYVAIAFRVSVLHPPAVRPLSSHVLELAAFSSLLPFQRTEFISRIPRDLKKKSAQGVRTIRRFNQLASDVEALYSPLTSVYS